MTEENLENKKERRTRKTGEGGQRIRKTNNKRIREKQESVNKKENTNKVEIIHRAEKVNNEEENVKVEKKTTRRRTKREFNTENKENTCYNDPLQWMI